MSNMRNTRKRNSSSRQHGGGFFFKTPVDYIALSTTTEYDEHMLKPAGMVVTNRVETISAVRGFFAKIPGALGGKSSLIQNAINDLTKNAEEELRREARRKFANVQQIIGVDIKINTISRGGADEGDSYMYIVATASGTALIPVDKPVMIRSQTKTK